MAGPYSSILPSVTVVDNFNRANGALEDTTNWVTMNFSPLQIASNAITGGGAGVYSDRYVAGGSLTDSEAYVTLSTLAATGQVSIFLRVQAIDANAPVGNNVVYDPSTSPPHVVITGAVTGQTIVNHTFLAGDKLGIRVTGPGTGMVTEGWGYYDNGSGSRTWNFLGSSNNADSATYNTGFFAIKIGGNTWRVDDLAFGAFTPPQSSTGNSGIPSAEAFGNGLVTATVTITGNGIPSAEAFGNGLVTIGLPPVTPDEDCDLVLVPVSEEDCDLVLNPEVEVCDLVLQPFTARIVGGSTPGRSATGSTGIPSGEGFGSGGTVNHAIGSAEIGPDSGIPSGETFGSGGFATAGAIRIGGDPGAGMVTAGAFGSGGIASLGTGLLHLIGNGGIVPGSFGTTGKIIVTVKGSAGIASAGAFGTTGILQRTTGIRGSAGIVSAGAFGSGGKAVQIVKGSAGITPGAFGSGGAVFRPGTGLVDNHLLLGLTWQA